MLLRCKYLRFDSQIHETLLIVYFLATYEYHEFCLDPVLHNPLSTLRD